MNEDIRGCCVLAPEFTAQNESVAHYGDIQQSNDVAEPANKKILLNAFEMSTVGHLSPGQWMMRSTILELLISLVLES